MVQPDKVAHLVGDCVSDEVVGIERHLPAIENNDTEGTQRALWISPPTDMNAELPYRSRPVQRGEDRTVAVEQDRGGIAVSELAQKLYHVTAVLRKLVGGGAGTVDAAREGKRGAAGSGPPLRS